jgi:hypothetical protein
VRPPFAVACDEAHTSLGAYTIYVENVEMLALLHCAGDRDAALRWLLTLPARVSEQQLFNEIVADLTSFVTKVAQPFMPNLLSLPLILNQQLKSVTVNYSAGEVLYGAGFPSDP